MYLAEDIKLKHEVAIIGLSERLRSIDARLQRLIALKKTEKP
jgi:hypothetical protein